MNIRAKIYGSSVPEEPIFRNKRPKGADSDNLASISVRREESRRGNSRGKDRHRLSSEQAVLRHAGEEHVVELVNLSAGGAMVRHIPELVLWDHVSLVFGDEGELECAVRWIKDGQAGLEFAHETRIDCDEESRDELLRAVIRKSFPDAATDPLGLEVSERSEDSEEPSEPRASKRHPLIWNGVVYHDYEVEPVRLRNISTTGALVQSSHPLIEGSTIFLELNGAGRHEAIVRWTRAGQSGLAFTHGFDISLLANVRPDVTKINSSDDAGKHEPWAPAWQRSTLDEIARTLGS
jgi:hypothetical protein